MPVGLEEALADLGCFYHWPPSELWELTLADVTMWAEQAARIARAQADAASRR